MASSSNNRVSDTAANSEEPEKSTAGPSQLSASSSEASIYNLCEAFEFQSSIYGTPRSDPGSIPGTSSTASSCDTGAAYFTPPEGSSTSSRHADSSSEASTPRPQGILNRMVQELMNEGDGYIAACIKVGRTVRHDLIREDFENNGYNDVPYDPEGRCNVYTEPPGSGRK